MRRLAPLAFALLCAAPLRAQSPFLRALDTRTMAPETVFGERHVWGADMDLGGTFNRGNVDINYLTTGFNVFRAWENSTAYLTGALLYNTFSDARLLNRGSLTARYDHKVSGPWKVFAFNTNAYNDYLQLNHRATTGVGPWYDLEAGETKHSLSAAIARNYERFKYGHVDRDARFSFRDISRIPISPVAQVYGDFFYVPQINQISDYRISVELGLQTIFWKDNFGLKVSWLDEYDNDPRPGVKHNDQLWFTALTARFGR